MNILYLVHDLNDAAVCKRLSMLKRGGANVTLAGFYRSGAKHLDEQDSDIIPLAQTYDASFADRIFKVVQQTFVIDSKLPPKQFDLILARNLDLLPLANRMHSKLKCPIVYECLDIHRFLIDKGIKGRVFRWLEEKLCRNVKLLITSSQGFIDQYFDPLSHTSLPHLLLENKVYSEQGLPSAVDKRFDVNQVVVSWNGAIRCSKSLEILSKVTRELEGRVLVEIYGRPSYSEFEDFDKQVEEEPYIHFKGGYQYPAGLSEVYQNADFNWTLDFFEQGGNSEWLLPNRIYEGGYFTIPPLYRSSTFTGKTLAALNLGIGFEHDIEQSLINFFTHLDTEQYRKYKQASQECPQQRWVFDDQQCVNLVSLFQDIIDSRYRGRELRIESYGA